MKYPLQTVDLAFEIALNACTVIMPARLKIRDLGINHHQGFSASMNVVNRNLATQLWCPSLVMSFPNLVLLILYMGRVCRARGRLLEDVVHDRY